MANKYPNDESTPANTDDALEGPQRIREIKQAFNERIGRDHLIGGITSPDVLATGADSADSGYHRRITIKEETSAQGGPADTRLNASSTGINHGTTAKMAEVWMEKHSGTADETSMLFLGTEGTGNQRTVVTTTQEQTLTRKTMTAPILNDATLSGGAGAIDGVAIGQRAADPSASPDPILAGAAAGKFTTLESTGDTVIGNADTDTLTLKAATNGLSSDAGGTTGANKFYAGLAGEIKIYAGSVLPAGWLWCNGAQYLRADYAELYAVILLTYSDVVGSGGNTINNDTYFRVPNLAGRIPIGSGTGLQTDGAELKADTLTARALGDYGADETHTLTAAQSGSGPHYHTVSQTAHTHGQATFTNYAPDTLTLRNGIPNNNYPADPGWRADPVYDTTAVSATIKASGPLDVEGTDETDSDAFRNNKTDLNTGVPSVSGHTQMQPFVVINYIIKY